SFVAAPRHYSTAMLRQEGEDADPDQPLWHHGQPSGGVLVSMATAAIATYRCPGCGRVWNADHPLWRCSCGSHLNLTPGRGLARSEIAANEASLWRYAPALALRGPPRISLGEGWTPLVTRIWHG